jgi:predicted nucleic acid-binding protein
LVEIVWVDESLHREAFSLMQNRLDKTYSLCDAVSFIIMHERGIAESLTTDKHFEQEGFVKLLKS